MTTSRADIIRRSPSGPIVERLDGGNGNGNGNSGASAVERIGALQAVAPATANGSEFVPIPTGASPPFAPTLEVTFTDVEPDRSILVLGTVTFVGASSGAMPEIRAELSFDGGVIWNRIAQSNAFQPPVDGAGNIALSCVSAPTFEKVTDLRARLTWRANMAPTGDSPGTDQTFGIDPNGGADAQIIAAVIKGITRP